MQTIELKNLIIPADRQRKDFDPVLLGELSTAIAARGLMHAIVVRETPEGLALVAGERRLRAITDMWMLGLGTLKYNGNIIPEGKVPYVTLGQLSPLEAEEAELEENLHRTDLSWQEKASAMSKLHRIRGIQAHQAGRVHTIADTALETKGRSDGSYQAAVRKDLIVAQHLHNPEVAKAKTADEAFKILKRQEETAKNIALAQSVGKTFTKSIHELYNMNCLDYMSTCQEGLFDVILTDPLYGIGADTFGDGGNGRLANNEHHYKDDYESWLTLMTAWAPLSFRITKPQAHAYVFCDIENFPTLKGLMKDAGWYVFRTPFICTKPNSGRVPLPDEGPRRQWECLLYAIKGHKKTTAIYPDVITTTQDVGLQHGAQKPVALFSDLLRRSVKPGDVVFDGFAGSGTIFPACHEHKCKAVGTELSPEYYGICLTRLADVDKPQAVTGQALGDELKALMMMR